MLRDFTPPDREMDDEESAAMAEARIDLNVSLLEHRCDCAIDFTVWVCRRHWMVHSVEIEHEPGCVIGN
jgi:hypothetical protein